MKKSMYKVAAVVIGAIASVFVMTGSYTIFYKPEIPTELRKENR